jgi:hypothetical protein
MKLYIESLFARVILLKSMLQEFDIAKRKMKCIIAACLDARSEKRQIDSVCYTM